MSEDEARTKAREILARMLRHEIDAETANILLEPLALDDAVVDALELELRIAADA